MASIDSIDYYGDRRNFSFDLVWPVGVTYTQYPGMKSPKQLWTEEMGIHATWVMVNYKGYFFRTFSKYSENSNGLDYIFTNLSEYGQWQPDKVTFRLNDDVNIDIAEYNINGATVAAINSQGEIVTATATATFDTGTHRLASFKVNRQMMEGSELLTNVYILQSQGTKKNGLTVSNDISFSDNGHTHKFNVTHSGSSVKTQLELQFSNHGSPNSWGDSTWVCTKDPGTISIASGNAILTKSGSVTLGDGDAETRPLNATLTVWLRTA